MERKRKTMSSKKKNAEKRKNPAAQRTETGLYNERMGRNSLQADDQDNVRNERHAQADAREDADEVMESFSKMDKETRARKDLGKGKRSGS